MQNLVNDPKQTSFNQVTKSMAEYAFSMRLAFCVWLLESEGKVEPQSIS